MSIPPGIKDDILAYYADMSLPFATKKDPAAWTAVQKDLITLQGMPVNPWPVPVSYLRQRHGRRCHAARHGSAATRS